MYVFHCKRADLLGCICMLKSKKVVHLSGAIVFDPYVTNCGPIGFKLQMLFRFWV